MNLPRRWITWMELVFFGGIPLLGTVLAVGAALTLQDWSAAKIGVLVGAVVSMWLVFGLILLQQWRERPTFVTLMGTAVWTNGQAITQEAVNDAINFYAVNVARAHKRLDLQTVLSVFAGVRIEFTKGKVWYGEREYAGLQCGSGIRVQWHGGFDRNAFFHECHHLVDELLLARVDRKHTRIQWWDLVSTLKLEWVRRES